VAAAYPAASHYASAASLLAAAYSPTETLVHSLKIVARELSVH
jgi:hypothetical protein